MNNFFSKFLSIATICICWMQLITAQQWQVTGVLPPASRYDDVYFLNELTGWTVNSAGEIFRTADGGDSWIEQFSSGYYLRSVEFINESIGFAGSLNGVLLRTEDGGENWTEIQDSVHMGLEGICGLSHVGNTVYGVGVWNHPAYFIKSTDQGITWTYTDLSAYASGMVDCHFVNENIGFVAGTIDHVGGVILKTIDGGETWEIVCETLGGIEYIWKMFFVNDLVIYGAVETMNPYTSIVKSVDGGDTWVQLEVSPTLEDIEGIGFVDEQKGWVGPRNNPLIETLDGGQSWHQTDYMANINRFFKTPNGKLYASGDRVYEYDDTMTGISIPDKSIYSHRILKLQPNPFDNALTITIQIDSKTRAKLDLIAADGRHVISLYAGDLDAGNHTFELPTSEVKLLGNQLYKVVLRTNERFLVENLMRIRN